MIRSESVNGVTQLICFVNICLAIDQCEINNAGCSQGCEPNLGNATYKCSCEGGYLLQDDGHACMGKIDDDNTDGV